MRKRGRPPVDDDAILRAVARRLAKAEATSTRSAIAQSLQITTGSFDSNVRRIQRKWRTQGERLLAEAKYSLRKQDNDKVSRRQQIDMELHGSSIGFTSYGPHPFSSPGPFASAFSQVEKAIEMQARWYKNLKVDQQREAIMREALMQQTLMRDTLAEKMRREVLEHERHIKEILLGFHHPYLSNRG